MDDSDDPWVTLKYQGCPEVIRLRASGDADAALAVQSPKMQNDIQRIADAVHQAYLEANNPF